MRNAPAPTGPDRRWQALAICLVVAFMTLLDVSARQWPTCSVATARQMPAMPIEGV